MLKLISLMLLTVLLLSSCGPYGTAEQSQSVYPVDLKIEVNHQKMTVSWEKHGSGAISGYNVYIEKAPLLERYPGPMPPGTIAPFNPEPFPGDTNPEDGIEHFEAEQLENGVPYFVTVRVVSPDGSLSKPTREVKAVCGGRGTITLPVRFTSKPDGFSFVRNEYVEADALENDLLYLAKDGEDILMSASRLGNFGHETRLAVLKQKGDFGQITAALKKSPVTPESDRINVALNDWILARTDIGAFALLQVTGFTGEGKDRKIELYYAYSALKGEIFF